MSLEAADVGPPYGDLSVRSVRQRAVDEEIFEGQARLWRALNPRATPEQYAAAMGRVLDELEGEA